MFKKSLQILILCALVTLAAIVAFALLRLRGPDDTLREARAEFAAGNFAQVLVLLNQAAPSASVRDNPKLREQLWRLRFATQSRLDNPAGALEDVNNLLANGHKDDLELQLDQIRLLARDGKGDHARLKAKQFLERNPEHSRGLELAGEAGQTAYQPMLRELREHINAQLSKDSRKQARSILLAYLYRPDGDDKVQRAAQQLEQLFGTDPQLLAAWPDIWRRAKRVRSRIQESLQFFQKSLDLGGEPVAAFRAIATALEQSGRIDDLMLLCEIQRRKFTHNYVNESGVLAAWVRIQAELPAAAVQTIERWLPTKTIPTRAAANTLPPSCEPLALARSFAAWKLADPTQLKQTNAFLNNLRAAGLTMHLPQNLSLATRQLLSKRGDPTRLERSLHVLFRTAIREPAPLNRPDFVAAFAPAWIDAMLQRGATEPEVLAALARWQSGRPDAAEPHLRTAEYLLSVDSTAGALASLADARKVQPDDPRVFPLHLRIARRHYQGREQDGDSLLMQCMRSKKTLPETSDAIGYVLCAESAIAANSLPTALVALACARNAIGAFPRANIPRQLELKALLQQQLFEEAARTAASTLQAIEPDAITLELAMQANRATGAPVRELVRRALPKVEPTPELQTELLRIALADAPTTAAQLLNEDDRQAASPLQLALRVRAYVAAGQLELALRALRSIEPLAELVNEQLAEQAPEQAARSPLMVAAGNLPAAVINARQQQQRNRTLAHRQVVQQQLAQAFAEWLSASSEASTDADLLAMARRQRERLQLASGPQTALLAAAAKIADTHPETAFDTLTAALAAAAPTERNGELFELAGELALKRNDLVRAESHWLAALGFGDGRQVAERLARLLLLSDDEERAARVYDLVAEPTDGALAARFGKLQLAAGLMAQALQAQPSELLNHAALATFGQPTMIDWQAPSDLEVQTLRLELLAALRDPALAQLSLVRAEAMLRADPTRRTHYLLVARASADAGLAAAAGRIHAELFATGFMNQVLWHEVARAGQHEDYVTSPALMQQLMTAATAGTAAGMNAGSELTLAYGMQQIAKGFADGGYPEMAQKTRLAQWLSAPHLQACAAGDIELITTGHNKREACFILDQILKSPYPCDRQAVLASFYRLANELVAVEPKQAPFLLALAGAHLKTEGALGAIVHFLLHNQLAEAGVEVRDLLTQHLTMIAQGRDGTALLQATVAELIAIEGLSTASETIETLLARYPTSLALWALRARMQTRMHDSGVAIDELRNVLRHAHDDHAQLEFLTLAAAARRLAAEDLQNLKKLPADLLASPTGQYAQGLLFLRQGLADQALACLETAAPQPDGRHLFEFALAHLEGNDEQGVAKAIALLEKLRANYPNSSLARNAGSFVRQLSPQ